MGFYGFICKYKCNCNEIECDKFFGCLKKGEYVYGNNYNWFIYIVIVDFNYCVFVMGIIVIRIIFLMIEFLNIEKLFYVKF